MPRIDELQCPEEREILQTMIWAVRVQNGYTPNDTPSLVVNLAFHRRECPFCNGTALKQLFGQPVVVVEDA